MSERCEMLLEQRDGMKKDRWNFENLYEDVSRFIFPQRARVNSESTPGEERTQEINDSTATNAAHVAASAAQGSIVPSTTRWFSNRLARRELEELPGVPEWLHELTQASYNAINGSNFQTEIQEVFLDLFGYGTGCVFTGQRALSEHSRSGFRGLHFKSTQPGFYVVGENEDGLVDTIFRDFKLSAAAIKSQFGGNLGPSVQKAFEAGTPHEMFTVTHYVGRRLEIDPFGVKPDTPANRMPFRSTFLIPQDAHIIREGGFFDFPYQVPRWSKMSGELFGRGPGINSLPDIRTLNRAMELGFGAWEKAIDPPMGVMFRSVMGNIDMRARGVTMMRQPNAVFPLHQQARFDVQQINVQDLRDSIRKAFFIDQIQLPPMGRTPATATEIAGRFETMQRILGPTFGRIQYELFDPMLNVIAGILIREGVVPPPPDELVDALTEEGLELEFEYEGPLTRAQQFQDVENIQRVGTVLASLMELWPEVGTYFDGAAAGKAILAASSLPPQITKSDERVKEEQEQAQQQQQMQMGQQQALEMTQAVKNVTPLLQGGGLEPTI